MCCVVFSYPDVLCVPCGRIPNNGKQVAATLVWRLSLEHALLMVTSNRSRTTYAPAQRTLLQVKKRFTAVDQGKRPRRCKAQMFPVENTGLATKVDSRLWSSCKQQNPMALSRLVDRFVRSNRESRINASSLKTYTNCTLGATTLSVGHACSIVYRYQHGPDNAVSMDVFPGVIHLFASAIHVDAAANHHAVHLVLVEWLKYDSNIDIVRGGLTIIKNYAPRTLDDFDNVGTCPDLDLVAVQQILAPAMLIKESKPEQLRDHGVHEYPKARGPTRQSLVVFQPC